MPAQLQRRAVQQLVHRVHPHVVRVQPLRCFAAVHLPRNPPIYGAARPQARPFVGVPPLLGGYAAATDAVPNNSSEGSTSGLTISLNCTPCRGEDDDDGG